MFSIRRRVETLGQLAERTWYLPLVAFLSALDAYVLVVPNEALLIPAVLAHANRPETRRRFGRLSWLPSALWVTVGSALGAASFAVLTSLYGEQFVEHFFPNALHSKEWLDSVKVIQRHGGWGLALVSLSPFPQHPAVAIAGLAKMNALVVFLAVFLGRLLKYGFFAWAAVNSPEILRKLRILPRRPSS